MLAAAAVNQQPFGASTSMVALTIICAANFYNFVQIWQSLNITEIYGSLASLWMTYKEYTKKLFLDEEMKRTTLR